MRIENYRKLPGRRGLEIELAALRRLERAAEHDRSVESLLLWEAESACVVLPRNGSPQEGACEPLPPGIPVLRRESGGGAVLLGPGCLNYAVVLSLDRRPWIADVEHSYRTLLGALASSLSLPGAGVIGSDLVLSGRKFGGHAQRRTRHGLLHHGTILYDFEIEAIRRCLPEPRRQPAYRRGRTHDRFLVNAPLALDALLTDFGDFASALG